MIRIKTKLMKLQYKKVIFVSKKYREVKLIKLLSKLKMAQNLIDSLKNKVYMKILA